MSRKENQMNGLTLEGKYYPADDLVAWFEHDPDKDKEWKKEWVDFLNRWFDPDPQMVIYTSGTTGKPKILKTSKLQMVNSARMTGEALALNKGDNALLCLPVKYIAGMMMVVRSVVLGLDLTIRPPVTNPARYLTGSFVFSAMTAMQVWEIIHKPEGIRRIQQVRKLLIGGGPLAPTTEERLRPLPNQIWHTYAMTETLSHVALRRVNGTEPSRWYTPLPGVQVSLDRNQRLEIAAPALSEHPLISDDIAEMDEHGRFRILGRYDNVVISGGLKCIPERLEEHYTPVLEIPFFITGWPDEKLGEKIVLVLEQKQPGPEHLKRINAVSATLPDRRLRPRAMVTVSKFHRTESGKINRKETMVQLLSHPDKCNRVDLS